MLTKSILVSSFAALALANAVANPAPRITAAPVRRQSAGEVGDKIDEFAGDAGSKVDDILDGAGTKVGDLVDKASSAIGDATQVGACASAAKKIGSLPPTPTGDLASAIASGAVDSKTTDICKAGDELPEDLKEDWESYKSEVSSWYAEHSDAIQSAVDECPTGLGLDNIVSGADCITGESGSDGEEGAAVRFTGMAAAVAGVAVGAVAVLL